MVRYLQLNDLNAYKVSFHLSNYVWDLIVCWKLLPRDVVGKQFARAVDSISANIAEGFGRHGKKDKIHFYHYAFGSLMESLDWNEKAYRRELFTEDQYTFVLKTLKQLQREIHHLIRFTDAKLSI